MQKGDLIQQNKVPQNQFIMSKYVRLQRAHNSSAAIVKRSVVIKGTRKSIGQGGRLCDVKYPSGKVKKEIMLSVVESTKNEEIIILEETKGKASRIIPDEELKELKFKFTNFDF